MPKHTLASSFEKSLDGRKIHKDSVTINACSVTINAWANGSVTITLPLLLIKKPKNPRCFKHNNRDNLPVIYCNQSNAWVNAVIFTEWFQENFVPTLQRQLQEEDAEPRAVLLLDNCWAHTDEDKVIRIEKYIAKFFPPNVTSLI